MRDSHYVLITEKFVLWEKQQTALCWQSFLEALKCFQCRLTKLLFVSVANSFQKQPLFEGKLDRIDNRSLFEILIHISSVPFQVNVRNLRSCVLLWRNMLRCQITFSFLMTWCQFVSTVVCLNCCYILLFCSHDFFCLILFH